MTPGGSLSIKRLPTDVSEGYFLIKQGQMSRGLLDNWHRFPKSRIGSLQIRLDDIEHRTPGILALAR